MPTTLLPTIDAAKPHRWRWIPLSLKIFAAILGMLSVVTGWEAWRLYRQHDAIREIERAGGVVFTEPGGPDWLRPWIGQDWDELLDQPAFVCIDHNSETDGMLVHLSQLSNLRSLRLAGPRVTDERLIHLKSLTALETLKLGNTSVTDAGLVHLRGLKNLQDLSLSHSQVTGPGLKHLRGLIHLKSLDLTETNVTGAGIAELQAALPVCKIGFPQ
jgi:Leucine-rich repeat (LRR) protein